MDMIILKIWNTPSVLMNSIAFYFLSKYQTTQVKNHTVLYSALYRRTMTCAEL